MAERTFLTHSAEETEHLAETLAARVPDGALIYLEGPLGSGKTTFVRGFARGMGVDPGIVSSPSYILIHDYETFVHVDLYRLLDASFQELVEAGIEDVLHANTCRLVEWVHPELEKIFPPDGRVRFDWGEKEDERKLTFYGIIPVMQ